LISCGFNASSVRFSFSDELGIGRVTSAEGVPKDPAGDPQSGRRRG